MRLIKSIWIAGAMALLLSVPAIADDNVRVTGQAEIRLGDFEIVIGDLGNRSTSWYDSPTRIEIGVLDGYRTKLYYFDSLPAGLFVLRQIYRQPSIVSLDVPDYYGGRLIDGLNAYYVWDYNNYSRGGLPLLLAFRDYRDAQDELGYRDGYVMDFRDVVKALYRWSDDDRDRIYWRGWHRDRWDDNRWNRAWNSRWRDWDWDHDRGWRHRNADDYDRGGTGRAERYERGRVRGDGDRADRDRRDGDRDRDRDRERDGDRDRDRDRDRVRDNGKDRDNNGDRERDGDRDRVRENNGGKERGKDRGKDSGAKQEREKGKGEKNKDPKNRQSGRMR